MVARWEIGGLQTQQSASLGPGGVAASSPLAGSELSRVRTQLVLRAHESECKSRPGLSRFADQNRGLNSRKPFAVSRRRTAAMSLSSGCPASTHDANRSI